MTRKFLMGAALMGLAASAIAGAQAAQTASPNLAGNYRCEPDPSTCQWSGQTFTVTQSGSEFDVKNEKGEAGKVTVTSNISLSAGPPWNMIGVIMPDNRNIQWSNGTLWRKQ